MRRGTLNLIFSLIFLAIVVIGFYSIWSNGAKETTITPETFATLDTSGIKEQAQTLVANRENNANLPLPVPTTKMGRTNPFSNPE